MFYDKQHYYLSVLYPNRDAAILAAQSFDDCIDFDGNNCNEVEEDADCSGWDCVDRRCQCGNRRVSWESDKNHDDTYTLQARAY